jgi:hypothetical protein
MLTAFAAGQFFDRCNEEITLSAGIDILAETG